MVSVSEVRYEACHLLGVSIAFLGGSPRGGEWELGEVCHGGRIFEARGRMYVVRWVRDAMTMVVQGSAS